MEPRTFADLIFVRYRVEKMDLCLLHPFFDPKKGKCIILNGVRTDLARNNMQILCDIAMRLGIPYSSRTRHSDLVKAIQEREL